MKEYNLKIIVKENGSLDNKKEVTDRLIVREESVELFNHENIVKAVETYKADTSEKEIAIEFIKSYLQFLNEIISNDIQNGLQRSDIEIRDIVGHVNMMMRSKDEYTFTTMMVNCPSHYSKIYDNLKGLDEKE